MESHSIKHFFWQGIARILSFISILGIVIFCLGLLALTFLGGYITGQRKAEEKIISTLEEQGFEVGSLPEQGTNPAPTQLTKTPVQKITWGGPQLWDAVNKKRVELGVNPLQKRDELCTIASIRLNELLQLGKLDAHEGFSNLPDRRTDLKWIFEKYPNVSEFLAMGGESAEETVALWENTLGHRILLSGGEYIWGCTYAQNSFAVAIAAY